MRSQVDAAYFLGKLGLVKVFLETAKATVITRKMVSFQHIYDGLIHRLLVHTPLPYQKEHILKRLIANLI
jgi:hypothetical protein